MSSKEWKTYKLGDLVKFQRGHDLSKSEFVDGNIPIVGSNGIIGYHNKSTCNAPCITIGRSGSLGTPFFYNEKIWAHNTTLYVKEFYNSDPKFMYYLLQTIDFKQFNSGSAVPSLNRNYIHPIEVVAPELQEQQRIASILSSLDDKIELNRQTNQTLEVIAQALFQEMCVPKGEELPEGWRVGKLGEIMESKGGTTPSTKNEEFWNGEYNWVTPKDLSNKIFPVLLSSERTITEKGLKQISSGLLPKGTLLMSSRAPIGYFAISQIPVAINQGFIAINGKSVSNLFLLYYLRSNIETIKGMANGSTFLEISKSVFRGIEIVIPPNSVLEKFDFQVKPIFEQIVSNEQETQTLIALRDSLLPKLMKGEIEI